MTDYTYTRKRCIRRCYILAEYCRDGFLKPATAKQCNSLSDIADIVCKRPIYCKKYVRIWELSKTLDRREDLEIRFGIHWSC